MYLLLNHLFTTKWNEVIGGAILWALTGVAHVVVGREKQVDTSNL